MNDETLAEERGERGQSGGPQSGQGQPGSEPGEGDLPDWMEGAIPEAQILRLAEGLAEALDQAQADRNGDPQQAGQNAADPFGRSPMGGVDDSNSVNVPDEAERQRAKDILDELRRRYDEAVDEDEREYLERLLDRF